MFTQFLPSPPEFGSPHAHIVSFFDTLLLFRVEEPVPAIDILTAGFVNQMR